MRSSSPLPPVVLAVVLAAGPAPGATLDVPGAFATVGAALAASAPGDTVLVAPGTYPERVTMVDGVVLRGSDPMNRPVLDGTGDGVVLTAVGCGPSTRVEDLVLTDGLGPALGGGAHFQASSLVLERVRFAGNRAQNGGGLGADGSAFLAIACEFADNVAEVSGGGLAVTDVPSPTLTGCVIRDNVAGVGGGLAVRNGSQPVVDASLFVANRADQGSAVWWDFLAGGTLAGCTLVSHEATGADGGTLFLNALCSPLVTGNILAFAAAGGATFAAAGAQPTYGCNDAFGNTHGNALAGGTDDGTNFSLDPLFCDAAAEDWTVRGSSPCVGGPCGQIGAFGVGCTAVTVQEPELVSWGRLKQRWRPAGR